MYNRASWRCDQSWTTVSSTNTLNLTHPMLMHVQVSCGSSTRKDQTCHYWIWGRSICRCGLLKLYGHFRWWCFMAKGTVWPDWVSTWISHCKSWRPSLVLCCPKRRRSKRQCQHTSMTFTSTKMSAQCHTSERNWHSLAWIARIQSGLKTECVY